MSKTKTVFHPTVPGAFYEVPEADASKWKEQGWRFTDPATPAPKASAPDPVESSTSK